MSYNSNDMMAKVQALSLGEKLVGGGSLLMIVAALIFKWVKVSVAVAGISGGSVSRTALGDPAAIWGWLILLVAIVLFGIIVARVLNMQLPALPTNVTWGQVFGAGAVLEVLFVLLKAWRIQSIDLGLCGDACSKSFGIGFFLGVIAAAAIAYGGYLLYSEDKGAGFGGYTGGFRR
jgi:hypothetical protein